MRGENRNCDCTTAYRTYILRLRPAPAGALTRALARANCNSTTLIHAREGIRLSALAHRSGIVAAPRVPTRTTTSTPSHFDGFRPNWGQYRKRPKIGRAVNGVK